MTFVYQQAAIIDGKSAEQSIAVEKLSVTVEQQSITNEQQTILIQSLRDENLVSINFTGFQHESFLK